MKCSDLTTEHLAIALRLEAEELDDCEIDYLEMCMDSAKSYISNYVNMPITAKNEDCCDDYEEISHAVLIVAQDMYDNRSMYVQNGNINKVLSTMLDMHRRRQIY